MPSGTGSSSARPPGRGARPRRHRRRSGSCPEPDAPRSERYAAPARTTPRTNTAATTSIAIVTALERGGSSPRRRWRPRAAAYRRGLQVRLPRVGRNRAPAAMTETALPAGGGPLIVLEAGGGPLMGLEGGIGGGGPLIVLEAGGGPLMVLEGGIGGEPPKRRREMSARSSRRTYERTTSSPRNVQASSRSGRGSTPIPGPSGTAMVPLGASTNGSVRSSAK